MNRPTGNGHKSRLTAYESLRRQLISRDLAADPVELPKGFVALFASEPGDAPHHAHLFRSNGQEAEAPLTVFIDAADFTAWIDGLREAVERGDSTVEAYWCKRAVIVGQADEKRHTRKTATAVVHGEIDALVELRVFAPSRGQALKAALTTAVIKQHVRDGMTTRDIIERYNQKRTLSPEEQFAEDVFACTDDINTVLPRLAARYQDLVIVAALAEHVGDALRVFMQNGVCNPTQARRVLKHLEDIAFSGEEVAEASGTRDSGTKVETPFRLSIALHPYDATRVIVERDLTQQEAFTFLSSMWAGLEAEDPTNEPLEDYLVRLSEDSRESVTVSDSKFGFELYRSASCDPPTVRLDLPKAPREPSKKDPR